MTNRLNNWIDAIAFDIQNGVCPDGIVGHIQKHCGQEFLDLPDGRLRWVASMDNLLAIYKRIHKIETTDEDRIERLQTKYEKNPQTYTPEPKGTEMT